MDSEPQASPESAPREHIGGVLGVLLGLLVLLGSLYGLMAVRGGEIEGAEELTGYLGEAPYVFGLELAEAARLPTGELVVRLAAAGSTEEAEPATDLTEGAEPSAPARPVGVVFVEFAKPEAALRVFRSSEGGGGPERGEGGGNHGMPDGDEHGGSSQGASATLLYWEKDPSFAWHTTIEQDEIAWSRWTADYRIERSFQEGGSWRDSVRVNLTQKGRNLLLFAQWPDERDVSKDVLRELLRSVHMLELES